MVQLVTRVSEVTQDLKEKRVLKEIEESRVTIIMERKDHKAKKDHKANQVKQGLKVLQRLDTPVQTVIQALKANQVK